MDVLNFKIKLTSPAFIAGCMEENSGVFYQKHGKTIEPKHRLIGKDGDGLRPSSLRGVLRFWFRAKEMAANIDVMKEKESWLFGSTTTGTGIRLMLTNQSSWKPQKIGGGGTIKAGSALSYLGYGPLNYASKTEQVSSHNSSLHRDAIPAKTEFEFKAFGTPEQLTELVNVLLLLHLFGGIGARSRRGWGSAAVIANFLPSNHLRQSPNKWFEDCLRMVWPEETKRPAKQQSLPHYSLFCSQTQIRLSTIPHQEYEAVMDEFFEQFKNVRLWRTSNRSQRAKDDHDLEMSDAQLHQLIKLPVRLAYGLPYHPASLKKWDIEYKGYYPDPEKPEKKKTIERRSSPLFLKVFEGPDRNLYAVSLFLKSHFFGRANAQVGAWNPNKTFPMTNWTAIHAFLNKRKWDVINLP